MITNKKKIQSKKVHKLRSVRPTINQFQKEYTKPVLIERKQDEKRLNPIFNDNIA